MKCKGIIFDLDGTLVDSLLDIANAMNRVLEALHYPVHSYEKYRYFIGSGLRNLVAMALPANNNKELEITRCYQMLVDVYGDNCTNQTKPYIEIVELLEFLKAHKIKLAVFSNKSDELTKKIVQILFPNYFEIVVGLSSEELKKPNPTEALKISTIWNLNPEEILFVGDSKIDMQTATNASMKAIGVSWGYRPEDELRANGATYILKKPTDLVPILANL